MGKFVGNIIVGALSLTVVSYLVTGIQLSNFTSALLAAFFIGIINAVLKPVLMLLTLPINLLTFGLFSFIVNAGLLILASRLTPGFEVMSFSAALIGSLVLSVVSTILNALVRS
ncbi:hypothetical protein A2154_00975 [Candidatus Gottesmanbacteria bacterium RBG_16_43_7]|uniref:Phage holin family protein n=1 Tax=Candidatus Gottesmanbacteria bacterium RBG_16_43_7 TaxID=1798373 RepID=A0A1F5Z7W1_9BACT|nr:MAG: hypothetical protein A2154_00975 [Candidatus Gottesmanbacteria bacterium RBG_16_43_7]